MKFLTIFIDTLRPNLMNLINHNNPRSTLDDFIFELGGTLYTNCYTPGPDTPRGLACFWSGQYPRNNGCDKRARYPYYWLNETSPNIIKYLKEKNFDFNLFSEKGIIDVGIFPVEGEKYSTCNFTDFLNFFKHSEQENNFSFLGLSDYAGGLSEYNYSYEGVRKGKMKTFDAIKILEKNVNLDLFDYIFIFSDHGHKLDSERLQSAVELLNRDRINNFLFVHKKDDTRLVYNDKLCAIMDIFPTIIKIVDHRINTQIDGIDLLSNEEAGQIIVEDHSYFDLTVNQQIEKWAIVYKDSMYRRDINGWYDNPQNPELLDELLCRYSEHFRVFIKEKQILKKYSAMKAGALLYTDGTPIKQGKNIRTYVVSFFSKHKFIKKCLKQILKK